ncbi:hypothetical protein JCM6882_008621 [Rhodosporidiobolus microsporus]
MFAIRSGGAPLVYTFTKPSCNPFPIDDHIVGPNTSYTAAYPADRTSYLTAKYRSTPAWEIELREGASRDEGEVKAVVRIEKGGRFGVSVNGRNYDARIERGEPFLASTGASKFCWTRAGPLKQFACWQVVEGKPLFKAAKWKVGYARGKGVLQINQAFEAERELLLASAIGAAVSKFY